MTFVCIIWLKLCIIILNWNYVKGVANTNEKFRITGVITVLAEETVLLPPLIQRGCYLPVMMILKHSKSSTEKPDQTTMRVITDLHRKNSGYGENDGWYTGIWEGECAFDRRKPDHISTHKVWYLKHERTKHIITSQFKAYMDTIRMLMYIELVVAEYMRDANLTEFFLWMDNYAAHNTVAVQRMLEKYSILTPFYPPNMTPYLQICDLVVNAPIKRKERTLRAERTYEAFQTYREQYELLSHEDKKKSKFKPGRPQLEDGIRDVLAMFDGGGDFRNAKFEAGLTRCFIKTGCVPRTEGGKDFEIYHESLGTRRGDALSLPMLSADDVETFLINEQVEEIFDGINAFCVDIEEENEEEDFEDDTL